MGANVRKIIEMKKILSFITFFVLLAGTALGQPVMSFNKKGHNFGEILWNKPVIVEFKVINTGTSPLVLKDVTVSCACTVLDWTKSPIEPGQGGFIKADFDAKALGTFHKSVAVFTNARVEPVYLNFEGKVVTQVTNINNSFAYTIGNISLGINQITFPDTYWGDTAEMEFAIQSKSLDAYTPVLMHLPPYLKAEAQPVVLQRNMSGKMSVKLDTRFIRKPGYINTSVYLSRYLGDIVTDENEIPVSFVVLPDFSKLTEYQRANLPSVAVSETAISMTGLDKKEKVSHTIVLSNKGKSDLDILNLQVSNPAIQVDLKKSRVKPGGSTKLKLTLNKKELDRLSFPLYILMITNDPQQPKVVVEVNTNLQ